jgi:hypothetical protein
MKVWVEQEKIMTADSVRQQLCIFLFESLTMWRMQRQLGTIAQRSIHVAAHTKRSPVALLPRTTLQTAALLPIGGRLVSATCGKLTVAYAISKRFYNSGPQGTSMFARKHH